MENTNLFGIIGNMEFKQVESLSCDEVAYIRFM